MESNHDTSQTRKAAVGSLAIVGFIALILIGIATAIYAATFLPKVFSQLSTANVYLSTLVQSGGDNQLQPATTTPAGGATSVPLSPATTTTSAPATSGTGTVKPTYTPPPTYTPTYQVVNYPVTQSYYGLPDLVTTITSVGYLNREGDTSSFVAADTVPNGHQGAVRFVIANRGTNVTGSWDFDADLPTNDGSGNYHSPSQRSLKPGDSIVYTLGFDSNQHGRDTVRITADPGRDLAQSNESNDTDTATIYLNGSSSSDHNNYDSNGNYCRYGTYYQNGHYYCESSSNSDHNNYDSNGNYCRYGTYYQNGHYYCESSSSSDHNNYDSNGNYCRYGTYYQNGRYYCESSDSSSNNHYDSNGRYCTYGTYYQNGRYYCDDAYGNNNTDSYDSNGNFCSYGTYYSNGRYYCN